MSMINRLNRIIRANVSDLRGDSHSGSVERLLGEMESSLRDARRQAVVLRRQEKKLVAEIRGHRDKADEWEERAMMALKQNEEDLARDALKMRNESMDRAALLREELDEHRAQAQDIESAIQALEMKLEGTRTKIGTFRPDKRRGRRPQASTRSSESAWDAEFRRRVDGQQGAGRDDDFGSAAEEDEFDDERLFREVDRMGSKIDEFEAQVEAMRELSDENLRDPGRTRLEERFRELERRRRTRRDDASGDDLADLKKKFKG